MARYRKVDARIQNDQKFRTLSERGKLVFFLTMTHPNMTMLGAMRASVPGLAAEWGMPLEGFTEAFQEVLAKGMVKADTDACFIWLPNFLKYNRPESPNVVKAWIEVFDLLPECDLKRQLFHQLTHFIEGLSEGYRQAFGEVFAKTLANQEQEQEQEQEGNERGAVRRRATDVISESEIFDGDIWFPQARAAYVPGLSTGAELEMTAFLQCCEDECRERGLKLMTNAAKWIIDRIRLHGEMLPKCREPDRIPYFSNFLARRLYRLKPPEVSNGNGNKAEQRSERNVSELREILVERAAGHLAGGADGDHAGNVPAGAVEQDGQEATPRRMGVGAAGGRSGSL